MDAFPGDGDRHLVGPGHEGAGTSEHLSGGKARPQVDAEDPGDMVPLQNAALAQPLGAAGGLLGGLEQEQHVPGQLREMGGDIFRQRQGHGGVAVVAAGVHLPGMRRGIGHSGGFRHRQGIHVRPEGHGLHLPGVKKGADAAGDGAGQGTAQGLQNRADIGHGLRQLVIQLRDAMEGAAVGNNGLRHRKGPPGGKLMHLL